MSLRCLNGARRQLLRELLIGVVTFALLWGGLALYISGCGCTYYATSPPLLICR